MDAFVVSNVGTKISRTNTPTFELVRSNSWDDIIFIIMLSQGIYQYEIWFTLIPFPELYTHKTIPTLLLILQPVPSNTTVPVGWSDPRLWSLSNHTPLAYLQPPHKFATGSPSPFGNTLFWFPFHVEKHNWLEACQIMINRKRQEKRQTHICYCHHHYNKLSTIPTWPRKSTLQPPGSHQTRRIFVVSCSHWKILEMRSE